MSFDDMQTEIDGKTVDTETGEIIEEQAQESTVVDFRSAKQA